MQQTNQYQLNLIETSDTFSPAPLNENARKLDAAVAAEAQARAAGDANEAAARAAEAAARQNADAALSARVTVLEQPRIAYGKFRGNIASGNSQDFLLPFQPKAVLVLIDNSYSAFMQPYLFIDSDGVTPIGGIIPGGFRVTCNAGFSSRMNNPNNNYCYLALA